MGHRLSKSNSSATSVSTTNTNHRHSNDALRLRNEVNLNSNPAGPPTSHSTSIDIRTSVPATSTAANNQNLHIESTTVTVPAQAAARRFVIKIQLTKMEAGSSPDDAATTATLSTCVALDGDNGNITDNLDNNLNVTRPILNLTFTKNIQCDSSDQIVIESNEEIKLNNLSAISDRRGGGCMVNSNFISNFNPIQLIDDEGNEVQSNINRLSIREGNISRETSSNNRESNHCGEAIFDVPENVNQPQRIHGCSSTGAAGTVCACVPEGEKDHCCRRKKSSAYPSKWRCCKCICRTSTGGNSKDSSHADDVASSSASSTSSKCSSKTSWTSKLNCTRVENPVSDNSDMAMWIPPENSTFLSVTPSGRHLVPLSDVLLLTLNCPPSLVVGQIEDCDERARRLRALEIETGFDPMSELGSAFANALSGQKRCDHVLCSLCSPNFRHVVHSQVDYIHCLVPDLDKITNSSFYWGKMDRYEAERLLEGKPEGTFLLRDSAQEEYLFSVTFRKYGRSLHARIEQFNHKFSFDCHDPGVFTARTVTGLLEHYKDPSCVMFFEPMLTIPLHRNFTFSLQQLCRATIVSHVTYDGINELQLPNSLKSYLKEYHYKLRVRVKPFDDFYQCS